jgi:small subunit ribosomal protein S24e
MEVTIISQNENKLLNRTEITAEAMFDGTTPTRMEIKKELAKKIKADIEHIVLRKIMNIFGERKVKVIAFNYKDKKIMEHENRVFLNKDLGKKKAGEAKKEEKEAEPKKEEKKASGAE